MISSSIIATLAGVSGVIALLSLLAYFFVSQQAASPPYAVHPDPISPNVLEALKHLDTDEAKVRLLQEEYRFKKKTALDIVRRSKQFDPNRNAEGIRWLSERRLIVTAGLFATLAVLGLIYAWFSQRPTPLHVPVQAVDPAPPIAKPVYEKKWVSKQPSGALYSQAFVIRTVNRHNMNPVGTTGVITVDDIKEPFGLEKRITGAVYSCSAIECDWSKNYSGKHDGQYKIADDGKSITWFRSWDGDPVSEVNTVFYEVFTDVCINNCP